jgi:4a-hydroxytetrahydrobiopterin dehydratase
MGTAAPSKHWLSRKICSDRAPVMQPPGEAPMSHTPLSSTTIDNALDDLKGWDYTEGSLQKTFTFGSFREAVSFIVRLAFEAEALNHHPELFNVYNRVSITLRTHDAGDKVTELDLTLARTIDRIAWI